MFILRLALGNLYYNVKRTVALILIISVATTSIILYKGYVEYSKEGMTLGFIASSGDFQIATINYWEKGSSSLNYLSSEQNRLIIEKLNAINKIEYYDSVIDFSGIIGNELASVIFWGKGFDFPQKHFSANTGTSIFPDDEGILLGNVLHKNLGYSSFKDDLYLTLMANSPETGISLASVKVQGLTTSGVLKNDEGLLVATRKTVLELLEMDDCASFIQVYVSDKKDVTSVIEDLNVFFQQEQLPLGIKTWQELNPSFEQVNSLNDFQFYVISIILSVLIFIALLQSISTSFAERLGEFGTLEAIGLRKYNIIFMLICEILYLVGIGLTLGVLFSFLGNKIVQTFDITMTPPGYTEGFPLLFYIKGKDLFFSCLFIFITCMLSIFIPLFSIYKNSVVKLINKV